MPTTVFPKDYDDDGNNAMHHPIPESVLQHFLLVPLNASAIAQPGVMPLEDVAFLSLTLAYGLLMRGKEHSRAEKF